MIDKGEVGLDDPVAKYLPPDVQFPATAASRSRSPISPPTPRACRTIHATWRRSNPRSLRRLPGFGGAVFELLKQIELSRDPGVAQSHSNIGVGLLGLALARRAGRATRRWSRRITRPLGMTSTAVTPTASMRARESRALAPTSPAPDIRLGDLAGAGALNSTANDMLDFLAAELASRLAAEQAMATQISAVRRPIGGAGHGDGDDRVEPRRSRLTNGGTFGLESFMGFDTKHRVGVVVLVNVGKGGPRVTDNIGMHILTGAPVASLPAPTPPPAAITLPRARSTGMSADTSSRRRLPIVTHDGDRLFAQLTGRAPFTRCFPRAPRLLLEDWRRATELRRRNRWPGDRAGLASERP